MRNLRQYPITDEEILRMIDELTKHSLATLNERAPGDSQLATLQKLKIRFADLLAIEREVNTSY